MMPHSINLKELASFLSTESAEVAINQNGLIVQRWRERVLDPPVQLYVTSAQLSDFIDSLDGGAIGDGATGLWPGSTQLEAGLRLLSVHLAEEMDAHYVQGGWLSMTSDGIVFIGADGLDPAVGGAEFVGTGYQIYAPESGAIFPSDR